MIDKKITVIPGKILGQDIYLVRDYVRGSIHIYKSIYDISRHSPATDLESQLTYRELTIIWSKFLKQYKKSLKGDTNHGC